MTSKFRAPQDVADELGVDVQTVRRWIHNGRLRAFKPGKEYRIREEDLEEFLRAREVRPKAPSRSLFEPTLWNGLAEERQFSGWVSTALEGEFSAGFEAAKTSLEAARKFRDENFAALDAAPRPKALEAGGASAVTVKAAHRDFGMALLRANAAALLYETMLEGRDVRTYQAAHLLQKAATSREDVFSEPIPPRDEASEAS